jgi:GT2 family glycosyltransferase
MSTQIVELDLGSAPSVIRVRDDVGGVLVVITEGGRPMELLRMRRPVDGVLTLQDILQSSRAGPGKTGPRRDTAARRQSSSQSTIVKPIPVSVVIPTHERPDDLARCLEKLAGTRTEQHEVIVVDNAPVTNRTAAVVERFAVRYLIEPTAGANRARNRGLAAASHDIVAFVDDDVVVSRTWLETIGAQFADSTVGCATGLVLPLELETTAQEEFELYCQHRRDLHTHVFSRRVLRSSAAGIVGMGANMAFRREVLVALGGFDSRFGPGTYTRTGDETDMFARILDAGWAIVYTPDAYVWHRHRRTSRELRSCVFGYGVGLYSMLTKRLFEQRDFGALITGGRWLLGPLVKAARAKIGRVPSPKWNVVLAETAGTAFGPFCFGYETWRSRERARRAPAR